MKKVLITLALLCFIASPTLAGDNGRVGIQLNANNHSFNDLEAIEAGDLTLEQLQAETTQEIHTWVEFHLGKFDLGGDVHLLSPELGDFSDLAEFWLGEAYLTLNLFDNETLDVYLNGTLRESADNVQGMEEIFGSASFGVGTELKF